MIIQHLHLNLLTDTVITADAATAGGHAGLDYLPGSSILGAIISKTASGENQDLLDRLLSGHLHCLDAYPATDRNPTFPVPASFHYVKGEDWRGKKPLNLIRQHGELPGQPKAWRSGYMTTNGQVVRVPLNHRMRTAIERAAGRSKEGALYGYTAIPAGTSFNLIIEAADQELADHVFALLEDGELVLGRSRSAEYGVARIGHANVQEHGGDSPTQHGDLVHFYLLSDLAPFEYGMPTVSPSADFFGLHDGIPVPETSFVRTRTYALWNRYYNTQMMDRRVLCRGSVLTYRAADADLKALQENLKGGLGLYCEEGLGRVWVNPPWLIQEPVLSPANMTQDAIPVEDPKTLLTDHLALRAVAREQSILVLKKGRAWAIDWFKKSQAIAKRDLDPPGKTQWANIRALAIQHQNNAGNLPDAIKTYAEGSLRRKYWAEAKASGSSMLDLVLRTLGPNPVHADALALHHAAVEMGRKLSGSMRSPVQEDVK